MIAETLSILFNQNKSCKIRKVDLGSNHCFPEFQKFNFLDKNKSLLHLKNKNCPMWPPPQQKTSLENSTLVGFELPAQPTRV